MNRTMYLLAAALCLLPLAACSGGQCHDHGDAVLCEDSVGRLYQPVDASKLQTETTGAWLNKGSTDSQPTQANKRELPDKPPQSSAIPAAALCGDGVCNGKETEYLCPKDCLPNCGNGVIDPGEECEGPVSCTAYGFTGGTIPCHACKHKGSGLFGTGAPTDNCYTVVTEGEWTCTLWGTAAGLIGMHDPTAPCMCCNSKGCFNGYWGSQRVVDGPSTICKPPY